MTRTLIYIHSRRATNADRGFAYDVPESSALESDCDLDALLNAVKADEKLPWEERGYRRRGSFFYCEGCNGIVLEWESAGSSQSTGGSVCADCAHKIKHNIIIASVATSVPNTPKSKEPSNARRTRMLQKMRRAGMS